MLNTFIKNRGSTKTIIHDSSSSNNNSCNDINAVNELKWDADYDGDVANISVTSNTNGEKKHFNISLDNNDLEHILNIPSVDMPIHKRLKMDFSKPIEPAIYKIELPQQEPQFVEEEPSPLVEEEPIQFVPGPTPFDNPKINSLEQLLVSSKPERRYLTTPLPNEELIIPMSINKKHLKHTFTPRRHKKTHKTYRVYKKHKTVTPKKSTRRSSRRSTRRNTV
jgi:hypothetical protein